MRVGYLPDMFGHIAQMPQLLRLAGLEHAVVWRGVPSAIDQTAFWWRAPDGSTVRAEYLYGSYSNGRDIPKDPDPARRPRPRLRRRARPGRAAGWRHAPHERLRPPAPPAVARRRGGRGQRAPGRLPIRGDLTRRVRARTAHRRSRPVGRRAAFRRARQRADGRGVEPGRRAPSSRLTPNAVSSATPNRCRRCCSPRPTTPPRCSTSDGVSWCSTARTTRPARAAPTTSWRRCACATRRRATSVKP